MIILVFLLFLFEACHAATVGGRVTDSSTGLPLGAVQVSITGSGVAAVTYTDIYGNYAVALNAPGVVITLVFANAAYYTRPRTATVPSVDTFGGIYDIALDPVPDFVPSYLRVELSWNAQPKDLDLRILTPCGRIMGNTRFFCTFHFFFFLIENLQGPKLSVVLRLTWTMILLLVLAPRTYNSCLVFLVVIILCMLEL